MFYTLKHRGQFDIQSSKAKKQPRDVKAELCDRHQQVKVASVNAELCLKNEQNIVAVGKFLCFFFFATKLININLTILKVKTYYYCSKPHHMDKNDINRNTGHGCPGEQGWP